MTLLKAPDAGSPEQFADQVLQEVAAWSSRRGGRAPEDDITLLVVDVKS